MPHHLGHVHHPATRLPRVRRVWWHLRFCGPTGVVDGTLQTLQSRGFEAFKGPCDGAWMSEWDTVPAVICLQVRQFSSDLGASETAGANQVSWFVRCLAGAL